MNVFGELLMKGLEAEKYASFEGVEIAQIPWFYRHLPIKKVSVKDTFFVDFRVEISAKCKKLAPSLARLEGYLGCLIPYFWRQFLLFWK